MEEEQFTVDIHYLKGFNEGYILAEHTPDLVKKLLKSNLPENEYTSGFKAGKGQYTLERMKDRAKGITPPGNPPAKSKGIDKSR